MGERRFCYRCMEKYDSDLHICPFCGYDDTTPHDPMYITPGTILRDRYLVGILLEYNGEGATYEGHDLSTGCRVLLREYMPINLCTRVRNKATISVNYNNLAKYKAFMAEYTELNKSLARLRNDSNINPVLDMFAENNTTYTVFEHISGVKMLDYLKENAGELSWEQVSRIFPPLFTTIGRLHNAGIIHRAISPDTVYITEKGELRLSGFCISAVRTANAGLEYELFKGYAAPEQYSASSSSRQGSWTDVYGVCALIYRALTGCMPVDSMSRMDQDDLCEPHMLNSNIPQHVSRVIMDGMNLSGRDRIQTITELVTRLFEQPAPVRPAAPAAAPANEGYRSYEQQPPVDSREQYGGYQNNGGYPNTGGYPPPYYDDRSDDYRYEKVNAVDRIKVPVIISILLFAILLIILVVVINVLKQPQSDSESKSRNSSAVTDNVVSGTVDQSTEPSTAPKNVEVPKMVDTFLDYSKDKWKDYINLDPSYEFSDIYDDGIIMEQSVEPGEMVSQGSVIRVTVSKGKESAIIPDYSGYTWEEYKIELEKAGISGAYYQFLSTNEYGTPNTVLRLEVDGNTVYPQSYYSKKDGKKLTVWYIPADAVFTSPPTTEYIPPETEPVTETEPTEPEPTEPPVTEPPVTEPPQEQTNPEYGEW